MRAVAIIETAVAALRMILVLTDSYVVRRAGCLSAALACYNNLARKRRSNPPTYLSVGSGAGDKGGESADGSGRGDARGEPPPPPPPRRKGRLWCPVCLCVLTHIPVLEGLMHWLRMFHWCLVRLENDRESSRKELDGRVSRRRPTELDAAVFQLTLEVGRG